MAMTNNGCVELIALWGISQEERRKDGPVDAMKKIKEGWEKEKEKELISKFQNISLLPKVTNVKTPNKSQGIFLK